MKNFESRLLKKIDSLYGYTEKLEYLNGQFLKAKTKEQENIILKMVDQLNQWGC